MTALFGKKLGMTQVFMENGDVIPVTVVEAGPCCVIQVKTREKDGYEALKIGYEELRRVKNITKPEKGVFEKAGLKPYRVVREIPMREAKVGDMITVEVFQKGDKVDVAGISKGKGFQGVIKRHHYAGGPGSHGSMFNRAPGSIGSSSFPSRVWKNKGLPGHMGSERVTVKNLTVIEVKPEQNIMLIEGAVPGPKGCLLEIRKGA